MKTLQLRGLAGVALGMAPPTCALRIPGEGDEEVDASGCVLVPGFVDLACEAGFPGFPARETPATLMAAASRGGFTDLLLSPRCEPVLDTPEQVAQAHAAGTRTSGVRTWQAAALTRGLLGEDLTEVGSLLAAGARALSDGGVPLRDGVLLRNAMEYARGFGATLVLRPCDADLDALGVVNDSPVAVRLGLRGNPAASEEIGIARILALVRATGASVHLSHVGTARGVALLAAACAEGLPVTGAVPARSLLLDEASLDDGTYDTRKRLHPPLRAAEDRSALVAAVRAGVLLLSADHQPRAPEEKELEFERAVPGATGLETAVAAALTALGDLDAVVRGLAIGPRRTLGLATAPAELVGWALFDPNAHGAVDPSRHASLARNDALAGVTLRGRVRAAWPDARLHASG